MINIVDGKSYLDQVKELITEYTAWLGRDLSFQDLDKELADIAEKYTAPNGELLAAVDDSHTVFGMALLNVSRTIIIRWMMLFIWARHLFSSVMKY